MKTKRTIKKAKRKLALTITKENIKSAVPGDSCNCVVAQALQNKFGEIVQGVDVGPNKTKVHLDDGGQGTTWMYKTPTILRKQLPLFDKTGKWPLPPGIVELLPYPKAGQSGRHDAANPRHRGDFHGKVYIPTRRATINFG